VPDLCDQLDQLSSIEGYSATARLLFRKVKKGYSERINQHATASYRIQVLEARIGALEPRKRRKVVLDPNTKFGDIENIRKAQIEAGDAEASEADPDASDQEGSQASYIVVAD